MIRTVLNTIRYCHSFDRCQLIFFIQLAKVFRNFSGSPRLPLIFSIFRTPDNTDFGSSYHRTQLGAPFLPSMRVDCLYNTIHLTKSLMPIHSLDLREPMLLKFNIRRSRAAVTIDYSVVCWKQKMFAGGQMELKVSGVRYSFLGISDSRIHLSAVH